MVTAVNCVTVAFWAALVPLSVSSVSTPVDVASWWAGVGVQRGAGFNTTVLPCGVQLRGTGLQAHGHARMGLQAHGHARTRREMHGWQKRVAG